MEPISTSTAVSVGGRALKWTLAAIAATCGIATSHAAGAPLWSSVPSPFDCGARSNACVAHTRFNPNVRYWGALANPRGNCTNYASYRLSRNGARQVASPMGNAAQWASTVSRTLGSSRVNTRPAIGAIAWWSGRHPIFGAGGAGHVAYVEKIGPGGVVFLSDSSFAIGSARWRVAPGSARYPQRFLHIKDAPAAKPIIRPSASNKYALKMARSDYQPATFNGDGRSDIFWYAPGTTQDSVWHGTTTPGQFTRTTTANIGLTYTPVR